MVIDDPVPVVDPAAGADGVAEEELEDGAVAAPVETGYSDEQMARFNQLVQSAIGLVPDRGDTLSVINAPFQPTVYEPLPETALWEKPGFQQVIKYVLAAGLILAMLFWIVRPMVRSLVPEAAPVGDAPLLDADGQPLALGAEGAESSEDEESAEGEELEEDYLSLSDDGRVIDARDEARELALQKRLLFARALVEEDPARAANVLNTWLRRSDEAAAQSEEPVEV